MPEAGAQRPVRWRAAARLAASVGLLACVPLIVDLREVGAALSKALGAQRWPGLALALALELPVIAVMAWRWGFVSARLGAPLDGRVARREYWSSVFLNQVLPLGIAGDLHRTARHARAQGAEGRWRRAILAAVLDRAGAQIFLWLLSAGLLTSVFGPQLRHLGGLGPAAWLGIAGLLLALVLVVAWRRARPEVRAAIREASLSPPALAVHAGAAALTFALHFAALASCGWALGIAASPLEWMALGCIVLGVTSVPLFFAGWGVREIGVSLAFGWLGMVPSEGTACAILFGLVGLGASLPGAAFVLGPRRGDDTGSATQS